jgi:hypothetical protein
LFGNSLAAMMLAAISAAVSGLFRRGLADYVSS